MGAEKKEMRSFTPTEIVVEVLIVVGVIYFIAWLLMPNFIDSISRALPR